MAIQPVSTKKSYFSLAKISLVIRFLALSDFFRWGSWGLLNPIFAIYIADNISGNSLEIAGIAYGLFILTRSLFQIPVATIVDKIKGEKDDFWFLGAGSALLMITPILLIFTQFAWQLYIVQIIYGFANAAIYPTKMAIFTRHIDKKHEGLEWGISQTLIDFSLALAAFLGGFLVKSYGWDVLMIIRSVMYLIGTLAVFSIYNKMKKGKVLFAS